MLVVVSGTGIDWSAVVVVVEATVVEVVVVVGRRVVRLADYLDGATGPLVEPDLDLITEDVVKVWPDI
ncbi:hypothetical protein Tco_1026814 [Tanacetum coccineum]